MTASIGMICLAFVAVGVLPVRAEGPDVFDAVGKVPLVGVSSAPFSQWREADQKSVPYMIMRRCTDLCIGALGERPQPLETPGQPKTVAQQEHLTCAMACAADHLPKDHPSRAELQRLARQHYAMAKSLGSVLSPPTFSP